jgi:hypothetical protein
MTLAFLQSPIRFAFGLLACLFLATLVGLAHAETPTRLDAIVGAGALRVGLTEDYRRHRQVKPALELKKAIF